MAEVSLQPISRHNFKQIVKLKLNEGEDKFVAPNMYSIAEAYVEPDTFPMAVLHDEIPVGFMLFGRFIEDKGEYWIGRLMVDKDYRRLKIGERATKLALSDMKGLGAKRVFISFVPGNDEARALYEKLGFKDTGRVEEKEAVYCLEF